MNKIKWGILGCGKIAGTFAEATTVVEDTELYAAASRNIDKAREFCTAHDIPVAYGSYDDLLEDDQIEVVYIATPHNHHYEFILSCLEHGKAVLCEKPMTVNKSQAVKIRDMAQSKGLFVMEAMWTRFLPAIVKAKSLIDGKAIGKVRGISVDFSFASGRGRDSRVFDPALAGGALLDVGIYPITMASIVEGEHPVEIKGVANMGETGVDYSSSYILRYANGVLATLSASVILNGTKDAFIFGETGYIRLPFFWQASSLELHVNGKDPEILEYPHRKNGFEYEIMEVNKCIKEGLSESTQHPLGQTIAIMEIMDTLREQWDFVYPFE